jgi:hypothetical protein
VYGNVILLGNYKSTEIDFGLQIVTGVGIFQRFFQADFAVFV